MSRRSITDGPGGDSALVVSDGTARIVNQNDCRTDRPRRAACPRPGRPALAAVQRGDLVPDGLRAGRQRSWRGWCERRSTSQFARAMRYVEAIGARAVVPSAGPPCFLDPELFHLNVITGDELSIFPDQRVFLDRLAAAGHQGVLADPRHDDRRRPPTRSPSTHPDAATPWSPIFTDKAAHLAEYQADWLPWIGELQGGVDKHPDLDLLTTLQAWWQPLLAMAPTLRAAVGAACLLRAGDVDVLIDFPAGEVRALRRRAVRLPVRDPPRPWSRRSSPSEPSTGATRCSCRAASGPGGRARSTSTSTTSSSRCRSSGCAAPRPRPCAASTPRDRAPSPDIQLGDYVVQRRCPHRNADLAVFGEIDGCTLVCTLHGWRFDLETGRCLTATDHPIRARRINRSGR